MDYEAFCYDAAGNRTRSYTAAGATCTTANPAQQLSYDAANQLTGATGSGLTGSGFSYDGNGNQTTAKSSPGRTVAYNDRDQAVTTTPTGGTAVTSGYAGTGNNDRVTAGNTTFGISPLSPAPAWSAASGSGTWTVRDPQGTLIAVRQGSITNPGGATSYYPFTDQVDAVRTLVTTTGTVAAAYTYSAYGATKTSTGSYAATNPYRYGQGYTDTNSGLIKLGARYYDPTHGRFTQTDPSGQEANDYLYAAGNPCNRSDPTGLISSCALSILGVIGAGSATAVALAGIAASGGISALAFAGLVAEYGVSSIFGTFAIASVIDSCF
ncbi:RHS repeat-associated core domain-containing protein [Modestobacter roseus]|uniref:RHS repeat-associated core domain-containing protein n=1 Tax=Modestobacter roseus TaxID=1181884 RepID=UPI0034DF00FA